MINLDDNGLVPAIVQDSDTEQVLMLGYMSPESIDKTFSDGQVWFYSRSRGELWHKGETSGNYLDLKEAILDCDGDTILLKVKPAGPVCHTGTKSCFESPMSEDNSYNAHDKGPAILDLLFGLIQDRKLNKPEGSYTTRLFDRGIDFIAQKVIEEAGEFALASATGNLDNVPKELADLLYHCLVLVSAADLDPEDVWRELRLRRG